MQIDPGSVRFASLVDDEHGFTASFLRSFLPTLALDLGGPQRIWRGGYAFQQCTSAGVVEGRNEVVQQFLSSSAEWLFFVDSDMGWNPDALEHLMLVADAHDVPIVGGLCFGFGPIGDIEGDAQGIVKRPFPTIFDLAETDDDIAFRVRWDYRPASLLRVGATGAAFLLIHRSVLEAIDAKHGATWFDRIRHPKAKKMWGEDTSFCVRAQTLGFPVHVHTGVRTSHSKVVFVTESVYWDQMVPPPADEEVDVIVPVMARPHHAEPFMRSLWATTGLAKVTAVAQVGDVECIDAWRAAGADVLEVERREFAPKVNAACRVTSRPWVLVIGSDVRFRPGWWDHALQTARTHDAEMVATNDLLNGDVRDGRLATHPVVRRSALDEHGFTFDGKPGQLAHESYKHWWVDAEWSTMAGLRGGLVVSPGAIVEHLHPQGGHVETDDVYDLAAKFASLDKELFEKRSKRHQATLA